MGMFPKYEMRIMKEQGPIGISKGGCQEEKVIYVTPKRRIQLIKLVCRKT